MRARSGRPETADRRCRHHSRQVTNLVTTEENAFLRVAVCLYSARELSEDGFCRTGRMAEAPDDQVAAASNAPRPRPLERRKQTEPDLLLFVCAHSGCWRGLTPVPGLMPAVAIFSVYLAFDYGYKMLTPGAPARAFVCGRVISSHVQRASVCRTPLALTHTRSHVWCVRPVSHLSSWVRRARSVPRQPRAHPLQVQQGGA